MTNAEIYTMLSGLNIPVAYRAFNEPTANPFICFLETSNNNFNADNTAYFKRRLVDIELYTEYKDETTESALESVLTANDLPFDKSEEYIDTENMYMITYTVEV